MKTMKKGISVLMAVLLLISLVACGQSAVSNAPAAETTDNSGSQQTASAKIGMLAPNLQSEFFVYIAEGCKAAWTKEGYEVTAVSYDSDSSKGIEIIETFTISNVDCIVAMVSDNSMDDSLKAAMDKGIKVVVPGVETQYYDGCLVGDNALIGADIAKTAAAFVNDKLNGQAKVAAFLSEGSVDMAERSNAMLDTFKELCPDAEVVATAIYANVGDGTAAMENMLQQNPDINVVMSFGDTAAVESVEVFKAAGKVSDNIGIFGCDADAQALALISAGDIMRGTVYLGDLVEEIVEFTMEIMNDELETPYKKISKGIPVTAENIDEYM